MTTREVLKTFRRELTAVGLVLAPPLVLAPLGWIWLVRAGGTWLFLAVGLACAMLAGLLMLRRTGAKAQVPEVPPEDWPRREREALALVERFARDVPTLSLTDQAEALDLVRRTAERVARYYRPDASDPLTAFTLPEALLALQTAAGRVRRGLLDAVPLSDRVTVSQMLWAAAVADTAGTVAAYARRVWDRYRVVRPVINPPGALLAEVSALFQNEVYGAAKLGLKGRATRMIVLETGRAAIDLYAGRMRLHPSEIGSDVEVPPEPEAVPVRLLVAGQGNAGKSSLVNALAQDVVAAVTPLPGAAGFACFRATDPAGQACVLVDAPGLSDDPAAIEALAEQARMADAMLWTVSAVQPARHADALGLRAVRAAFARRPDLNPPPLLCVLTHIDQLRPFAAWDPPYDVAAPGSAKARSIRAAMDAVAGDLGLPLGDLVPVSMAPGRAAYNVDALRERIAAVLPEARLAQLARAQATAGSAGWWTNVARTYRGVRTIVG